MWKSAREQYLLSQPFSINVPWRTLLLCTATRDKFFFLYLKGLFYICCPPYLAIAISNLWFPNLPAFSDVELRCKDTKDQCYWKTQEFSMGFKREWIITLLPPHAAGAKSVQSPLAALNTLHSPSGCGLCLTTCPQVPLECLDCTEELGIYPFLPTYQDPQTPSFFLSPH